VNSNIPKAEKIAATILVSIFPLLLIPFLFFITPKFKTKQNEK
jgi:hypothetical protein